MEIGGNVLSQFLWVCHTCQFIKVSRVTVCFKLFLFSKLYKYSMMEYSGESAAQCGECGEVGSLRNMQLHFLERHCEPQPRCEPETHDISEPRAREGDQSFEEKEKTEADIFLWKDEQVLLLIRLVEKYYEEFNNGLKKTVWIKIAGEISKVVNRPITFDQVDAKWKGLKKTYKKIKDHNNQTGNSIKRWQYFHSMDSFLAKKPEIQPPAVCSSASAVVQISNTESNCKNPSEEPTSSKKRKVENETQRRHKEKMEKFDKFLKLFQVSVEHQVGRRLEED